MDGRDVEMRRQGRPEPLPPEMQGRWVVPDEPRLDLTVVGGEVKWCGRPSDYDYKEVGLKDGEIYVSLAVQDDRDVDAFQKENIVGLLLTADGELDVFNMKFASRLVRAES
jgi:hypothetical protein